MDPKVAFLALLDRLKLYAFSVPKNDALHPIRRIREALRNTPDELGLSKYGSAAGFAELIGRSPSLIRNVESGFTPKWGALAELIERKIKVSRDWMLSNPPSNQAIQHVNGGPWDPRKHLDPLAAKEKMPDWREYMRLQPAAIPRLIADLVHGSLVWELSMGWDDEIRKIVSRISNGGYYHNPGMQELVERQTQQIAQSVMERLWESRSEGPIIRHELERHLGVDLDTITIEQAERVLEAYGTGWIHRLDSMPERGPLSKLSKFYRMRHDPELLEYGDVNAE
jgi:transcriptional regulator with XRE-family HTH domain